MTVDLAQGDGERPPRPPGADEIVELESLRRQRAADRAALDAAQVRRLCLAELGERLRGCETAAQISLAAAEILGRSLDCSRTGYAVVDAEHAEVEADWTNGSLASLSGRHKFAALGEPYVEHIRRGEVLNAPDVETHPLTAHRGDWTEMGVRGLLNVPLLDNGRLAAMVYAHQDRPRCWTAEEVSLVQEVADRTWEAMSRARAVEALRRMNDTLEAQVRDRTLQRDRMWTLSTDLMMVTSLQGVILSVNPAWTRLLGWREEELVGASFYSFVHPEDRDVTRTERRRIEQGGAIDKLENRYLARDGRTVWLSWKAVPDGALVHSVARDITAEREQADALRAAEEALRHAQKMEAVGQLTGGIAHDFNNLLQGIVGALQLSEKRIAEGQLEGLAKYNAQAQQCAERAAALTHRLLAFSRRQPLDPRPVQANQLILTMEPLLRRTLGESIRLDLDLDLEPDLWPILCDPNQLDSAILNLSINARDAMPRGGVLTIRSRNAPDPENLDGGAIRLSVEDTGAGMTPDVMARAFHPFYTTKPIGQGTGLGLSMVYGFMRQSGGEAKIASAPGAGAKVTLQFRRHAGADAAPSASPAQAARAPNGEGAAVLVIEDEISVRRFVVEVLQQLGFQVTAAHDGPAGIDILQSSQPIDLLVTDIGLPGLNGRQVADIARQSRPALKVLFMTGYAEVAAMSDGFLAPGMGLITKPFLIETLAERIQTLRQG